MSSSTKAVASSRQGGRAERVRGQRGGGAGAASARGAKLRTREVHPLPRSSAPAPANGGRAACLRGTPLNRTQGTERQQERWPSANKPTAVILYRRKLARPKHRRVSVAIVANVTM